MDRQTAASLVPFLFVGAWNSQNETDKLGLSLLAGSRSYDELEKDCQSLAQLNDAPIWSVGTYRGVISKIDLLYAIAGAVTSADLQHYFSLARMVLGEDDPALDLDEDQRWATSIHGKTREFSIAFREGISETLVLLAVHGGLVETLQSVPSVPFHVIVFAWADGASMSATAAATPAQRARKAANIDFREWVGSWEVFIG